jgi:hypothetical protein
MNPVGVYYNVDSPVPFRRAPLAKRAQVRRYRPLPRVVPVKARRVDHGRINPYLRPSFGWRGFYDITGTVGQAATGAAVTSPAFVMPYAEPGLGELWGGHLDGQQLEGLSSITKVFKKAGKAAKKVVRSRAFKIAVAATAIYFTAGAAAPAMAGQMGAAGVSKAALAKALLKKAAVAAGKKLLSKAMTPAQPALVTPPPIASEQIILPPGYYWDAAGNVHDQAGNVYNRDGVLLSAAGGQTIGGQYEAATPADPGGLIPGEFPPSALTSSSASPAAGATWPTYGAGTPTGGAPAGPALAGIDASGILKFAVPAAIALVVIQAAGGNGRGRRRRRA